MDYSELSIKRVTNAL